MFNAKKFKQNQAKVWSELADVYEKSFTTLFFPATTRMLEEANIQETDEVLDLACSTGIATFMSGRLASKGRAVGIDIAPRMIEVATATAQARRLPNVTFEVMDAEKLEFKPKSFDVVVSNYGLAAFPDCHQALKEALRVLKPGGRIAASVLGRPEGSQFVTVGARAAFKHVAALVTHDSGGPTDFQFGAEGALEAVLNGAGFKNVRSQRFAAMITCQTGEKYWELMINGAGNFSSKIRRLEESLQEAVRREVIDAVKRYQSPDGIRLPSEMVVAYGEKPRGLFDRAEDEAPKLVSFEEIVERAKRDVPQMTPKEASALLGQEGVSLLDVRALEEHKRARIPRSVHVPRAKLEAEAAKVLEPEVVRRLLVYSREGHTGLLACQTLLQMGYPSVVNIEGGFAAWSRAQFPTEAP